EEAPVQSVLVTGADIALTKLPVHLQHGKDGGLYISAGMDFARDPATGQYNVGLRRFMLHGRASTGIDLVAPSDLRNIYLASIARGERLPLSVVVGGHVVGYLGATMGRAGDELSLLASLRAQPMPVVKCVSNDLKVPADAEWVLEGYLGEEGYQEPEGPYGEFLGYYGGVKTNPIFHVTPMTRRRDALFQTLTIGGGPPSRPPPPAPPPPRPRGPFLRAPPTPVPQPAPGLGPRPRPAACTTCASPCASAYRARPATPSLQRSDRLPMSRTCSWSMPTSTSSPTSRWNGRSPPASSRTATTWSRANFGRSRLIPR